MKKILVINWRDIDNPEAGGAEIYYHEIFKRLVTKGYEITILSHKFKGCIEQTIIDGTKVIRIGDKFFFNFAVALFIIKNQKQFDLIIEDINKIPFFTPLYCKQPRLQMVMHFFGMSIFKEAFFILALYIFLMEKLVRFFYKKEEFIAISESTKNEIKELGIPSDKIKIVEPGIDTAYYYPTQAKVNPPVIAYVGRLMKYKNVHFLIKAFPNLRKKVPGVKLEIAGTGDYSKELKRLCAELGVQDFVHFLGRVTEDQKRDLLSRAMLFANPSLKEGWGINNIEANLCGTVSVSSNVPGLRDSVVDGETGLLYKEDSIEDFCEKATLILTDATKRNQLESNAMSRAKTFDWDQMAERMQMIIDDKLQLI